MAKTIIKLKPRKERGNKEICENRRRIIDVPIVLKPIVVPVPSAIVPIEEEHVAIAIRTLQKRTKYRLIHRLLITLKVESNPESFYSLIFCTKYLY
ncbi:hypothetical protein KJ763_00960, partial [Patescibacteria group bacterium]|nr:hypothetical protein [Patescibacteria group bacterium]